MPTLVRWFLRLGPTNPICVRLVQGGSRRSRHMYIRTAYLAVLIAVLLWSLLLLTGRDTLSYRELAGAGAASFQYVAYLQIALICILAPVFMAGAIAQEANPKTWEILLTTPLSSLQVVLGNLFGRLFFVAALLFSSLPLFAITQYFGGVPGSSIFASYAIALCAALLVGSIAIALSVSRTAGRRAVFAFYVSVISFLGATWAIDLWLRTGTGGVTGLTPLNPFLALEALLNPTAYPRRDATMLAGEAWIVRFWMGSPVTAWCVGSALLSVTLLGACSITARRMGEGGQGLGANWLRSIFRLGTRGSRERPARHVWLNPIAWREATVRSATLPKLVARWAFLGAGALWGIGLVAAHYGGMDNTTFRFALLATVWIELAIVTLIAINMSSTAVSREREDGTLDLLLTTPVTPAMYLGGKLRGIISYLAPLLAVPLGTIALAALYVLSGGLGRDGGVTAPTQVGAIGVVDVPVVLPEAAILAPLSVAPFIAFVVMIGLAWSVRSKGTIGSVISAVGVIGAVSGVIGLCAWQAGSALEILGPGLSGLSPATAIFSMINLGVGAEATVAAHGLETARISLAIGVLLSAAIFIAIVVGLRSSMTRRFDQTVRRLAGTN
ncbi:MAG: hypothetical protein EA379_07175 [Phycisphaerales bacterium]|nr:MAG: hypothetical protein EA379_07175 [Phycisphaerales bacterium]